MQEGGLCICPAQNEQKNIYDLAGQGHSKIIDDIVCCCDCAIAPNPYRDFIVHYEIRKVNKGVSYPPKILHIVAEGVQLLRFRSFACHICSLVSTALFGF